MARGLEIVCIGCGEETLVRREPVYDGFKKVGEQLVCIECGQTYDPDGDVPYQEKRASSIFGAGDLTPVEDVFAGDEKGRNCRYCKHYIVNPFTQRCGLTQKIVESTDGCGEFVVPDKKA